MTDGVHGSPGMRALDDREIPGFFKEAGNLPACAVFRSSELARFIAPARSYICPLRMEPERSG